MLPYAVVGNYKIGASSGISHLRGRLREYVSCMIATFEMTGRKVLVAFICTLHDRYVRITGGIKCWLNVDGSCKSATFRNHRGNKVLVTWPTFELTTASESSFVPPFLPLVVSCEALPSFVISNEAFPSFVVLNEALPPLSFRAKRTGRLTRM